MSKRNAVSYVKPEEPSFLRRIKEQVGYREGPTVDTKREALQPVDDEDFEEIEDEKPTVVVLEPGDLTREEANSVGERHREEEEQAPADLTKPIVFKAPSKSKTAEGQDSKGKKRASSCKGDAKAKKQKTKAPLSFDEEEEDA